jgi:hypothetical protein
LPNGRVSHAANGFRHDVDTATGGPSGGSLGPGSTKPPLADTLSGQYITCTIVPMVPTDVVQENMHATSVSVKFSELEVLKTMLLKAI